MKFLIIFSLFVIVNSALIVKPIENKNETESADESKVNIIEKRMVNHITNKRKHVEEVKIENIEDLKKNETDISKDIQLIESEETKREVERKKRHDFNPCFGRRGFRRGFGHGFGSEEGFGGGRGFRRGFGHGFGGEEGFGGGRGLRGDFDRDFNEGEQVLGGGFGRGFRRNFDKDSISRRGQDSNLDQGFDRRSEINEMRPSEQDFSNSRFRKSQGVQDIQAIQGSQSIQGVQGTQAIQGNQGDQVNIEKLRQKRHDGFDPCFRGFRSGFGGDFDGGFRGNIRTMFGNF